MKIKSSNLDKPDSIFEWIITWGKFQHDNLVWVTIWWHSFPTIEVIRWNGKYTK